MNAMKKHLLYLVALCLFSWASFAQTVATAPSGNGTEGTPYQIQTLANLLWISENPEHWDKYYLQTADIDAAETASWNEGEGWVPIGTSLNPFQGNYNGGDFTISNLTINRPTLEAVGLFGRTNGAIVTQVNLDNVSIVGMQRIGALVGYALFETHISFCSSSGNLSGGNFVGGLVGNLYYASSISNSYSSANVEHNGDGFQQTGGLVGRLLGGHLSNCYATGNVSGDNWAGGLVGNSTDNSSITNSYSTGFVTGVARVGGLVGESSDTELTSCYWNNESSGQSVSGGGSGKTTTEMLLESTYQDWVFPSVWGIQEGLSYPYLSQQGSPASFNYPITELPPTNLVAEQGDGSITLSWTEPAIDLPSSYNIYRNNSLLTNTTSTNYTDSDVANYTTYNYYVKAVFNDEETSATNTASVYYFLGFAGGDGTEANPYQVSDAGQLSGVRKYSNAYFIQIADIDLGVAPWNQDEGWQPVHFGGVYNGNGYTISNLTINRPGNSNTGLFGYCSGEVLNLKNITITNANVNGSSYTGILAGYIYASNQEVITSCTVDGTVTSSMNQVGGIVGYFRDGSISKSSAQVTVNGNDYLGGAVGVLYNASITECYSTAIINGNNFVGGLVASIQHSTITNCYANGSITGYSAGGLLGQAYNTFVTNSFSFTQVAPQDNSEGGLIGVGWGEETTCENSYWDTEASGLTESYGGIGKTTAEMNDITTFLDAGWDFKGLGAEGIWNIGNDRNNGYPYLSWQYPDDPAISIEILPSAVITDVTSITQTSATFNIDVTNIGNPQGTQLGVCWSSTNPEPTTSDDNELSTEPFALGSYTIDIVALDHSTTYYARAFATNANGTAYSEVFTFTTECEPQILPFAEDFDSTPQGDIPTCWTISGTYSGAYVLNWVDFHSAPNSFYIYKFGSHNTLLSAPQIAEPLSGLRVKFWAKIGGGDDQLKVGAVANPNDLGTFEEIQTVTLTNSWQEFTVYLNDYVGNNEYIAFWYGNGSSWGQMFIDDVVIDLIPSCPEPYITIGTITQTTAEISWDAPGVSLFEIAYGPKGFNPQSEGDIISGISSTTYTFTDLNHSTAYEVYIRSNCGAETSDWSYPATFNTECGAHALPLTQNFDNSNSLPLCWAVSGSGFVDITDHNQYSTPYSARLYHGSSSYAILASPEIAGGIQDLRLRFKALLGDCPSIGNLYVGSMTDPTDASTFTSIQMFEVTNRPGDDWHSFEVWFDEYTGSDTHIAFRLGDGTSTEWVRAFIDNIIIDIIPSCFEPFDLFTDITTQTTAVVGWTEPATSTEWDIIYGPKGFNPLTQGELVTGASENPYTLTNLNPSTLYEFYVRTYCDGAPSGWSLPAEFSTDCGPTAVPITENFDNSNSLPLCWAVSGSGFVDITDHNQYSTPYSARLYHGSSSYAILASPEIAEGLQNLRLRFKALLGKCPSIGNLYVGSMTDPTNASTFTSIQMFEVTNRPGDDWHSFEVWFDEYTGSDTHIAFRLGDGTSTEWVRAFIDDIEIVETHSVTFSVVGTPANGTLTATLDGAAMASGDYIVDSKDVVFTATPADGYRVKRWTHNGTPVAGNTTNSYTVSGIQQNTSVTVEFETITYTLTYTASVGGSITGTPTQTVNHGEDGTPVTAVPDDGYHFVKWSDGLTTATRTDANVTANLTAEAEFAINTYTLTYTASVGGSITGIPTQTVSHGEDGTPVTAVPDDGYYFVKWSDGLTTATRTDANVTANLTSEAEFAINTYTLTYTASVGGSITGTPTQTVSHGEDGTPVTAVPDDGYHFVKWSDNATENPRTDRNVVANITVNAEFDLNSYSVTFAVTNAEGNPVEGAEISIDSEVITTNSNGEASTSLTNGSYSYSVTASGYEEHSGSFSVSGEDKSIDITLIAVGNSVEMLSDVEVYPNPFDQKIVIKGIEGVQRIAISNVAGQLIKNIKITNETEITIGTGNMSAGTYIVTLYYTNGDMQNRKIVKVN